MNLHCSAYKSCSKVLFVLLLLATCSQASYGQVSQKPDNVGRYSNEHGGLSNDVYWSKTSANSIRLVCKGYTFQSAEYTLFRSCNNLIIFMNGYDKYFYIENFSDKSVDVNLQFKINSTCFGVCNFAYAFVKSGNGFWILLRGQNMPVTSSVIEKTYYFGLVYKVKLENGAIFQISKNDYDEIEECIPGSLIGGH